MVDVSRILAKSNVVIPMKLAAQHSKPTCLAAYRVAKMVVRIWNTNKGCEAF